MASAAVAGGAGAGAGVLSVKKKQIVLLFDVDGTLIIGPGKVNKKALQFASNVKKKFSPERFEIKCLLFTARQTVVSDFTYFTDYLHLRSIGHTHEQAKEKLWDFQCLIAEFKKAGFEIEVSSIYDNKVGEYYQAPTGLLACDQAVFSQIDAFAKSLTPQNLLEIQGVIAEYPEVKNDPLAFWQTLEERGLCLIEPKRSQETHRLLTKAFALHARFDEASRTAVGQDASTKAHMLRKVLRDCYGIDRADHPALESLLIILHEDSQTVFAGLSTCKDPIVRRAVDTQMVMFDETQAARREDWDIKARWDYFRYHAALRKWLSLIPVVTYAAAGTATVESPVPGPAASPTVWQQTLATKEGEIRAANAAP